MKRKWVNWVFCLGGPLDGKIRQYNGLRLIEDEFEYVECNLATKMGSVRRFYVLSTLSIHEAYDRAQAHGALE